MRITEWTEQLAAFVAHDGEERHADCLVRLMSTARACVFHPGDIAPATRCYVERDPITCEQVRRVFIDRGEPFPMTRHAGGFYTVRDVVAQVPRSAA